MTKDGQEALDCCESKGSKGSSLVLCQESESEDDFWRDPWAEDVSFPKIGSAAGD